LPSATITSKGQITIPKAVREALRVRAGDRLDFVFGQDGHLLLRPVGIDVTEVRGLLYRKGRRGASVDQMNAAIRRKHGRRR